MEKWASIIKTAIENSLSETYTQMPAILRAYDAKKKRGTIECVVDVGIPILPDVPVLVLGSTKHYLHFPLQSGSTGLVLFSMYDFSSWQLSGNVASPQLLEMHGLYAMFLPGLRSDLDTLDLSDIDATILGNASVCMRIGDVVEACEDPRNSQAKALCKEDIFTQYAMALEAALNSIVPGAGSALAGARVGIGTERFKSE